MSKDINVVSGTFWITICIFLYVFFQPTVTVFTPTIYRVKYISYDPYFCEVQKDDTIKCVSYNEVFVK